MSRSSSRTRRGLSPLTVLGAGLLVAGLACLGWVAYQYLGTNVVSERAFQQESTQLRAQWATKPLPNPTSDPGGGDTDLDRKPSSAVVPGEAIALLRIPAFGEDYEVPILSGTDLEILSRGVGHYASTAGPGEIGNFAIAGHRVTHGQPFARLLELDKGDEIVVETREAIYTYVLDEPPQSLTVQDTDTWVLDPAPNDPGAQPTKAVLTLTTCQDLFRSQDRSVGFAHLASTQNKG